MGECTNCRCKETGKDQIILVGDFICPWCYIGITRLIKAIGNKSIAISWMPFELDRNTPTDGEDRKEQRIKKFGSWEASQEKDAKVREASKGDGIVFNHQLIKKTPNTFKAHRLMQLAEREGKDTTQLALLIFSAYFTEGKDIGDNAVLVDLGTQIGLTKNQLEKFLLSNEGVRELRDVEESVRQRKIDYIPYVMIGDHLFSGSKNSEDYSLAIEDL